MILIHCCLRVGDLFVTLILLLPACRWFVCDANPTGASMSVICSLLWSNCCLHVDDLLVMQTPGRDLCAWPPLRPNETLTAPMSPEHHLAAGGRIRWGSSRAGDVTPPVHLSYWVVSHPAWCVCGVCGVCVVCVVCMWYCVFGCGLCVILRACVWCVCAIVCLGVARMCYCVVCGVYVILCACVCYVDAIVCLWLVGISYCVLVCVM